MATDILDMDKLPWYRDVPNLLFFGNFGNVQRRPFSHLWSVNVEFQFYIFSPLIVLLMARLDKSYLVPLIAVFATIGFNYYYLTVNCPGTLTDNETWNLYADTDKPPFMEYEIFVY